MKFDDSFDDEYYLFLSFLQHAIILEGVKNENIAASTPYHLKSENCSFVS